jgi:hypothetical protein
MTDSIFLPRFRVLALTVCWAMTMMCTPDVFAATPTAAAQAIAALQKEFKEIDQMVGEIEFRSTGIDPKDLRTRAGPQAISALSPQFDRMTQFAAKSPEAEKMARIEFLFITARLAYWGAKGSHHVDRHHGDKPGARNCGAGQNRAGFSRVAGGG